MLSMTVHRFSRSRTAFAGLLLTALCLSFGCSRDPGTLVLTGSTMGTSYTIRVVGCNAEICGIDLQERIVAKFAEINRQMSS